MRSGRRSNSAARQGGLAYLLLLLAVALIALAASAAASLGASMARRDAEQHLLAIGAEFEHALRSYAGVPVTATGASGARGPRRLEDLLKDPRAPGTRRHLRQIHADPLTGKEEWGLVRDAEGTIVGVYSLAGGKPIHQARAAAGKPGTRAAETYAEWVFGLPR